MSQLQASTLHSLIDNLEAGVVLLDREQRVVHWNQWFASRCGQSADSARGGLLHDVLPGIANSRLKQAVEQAIRHGMPALLSPALHGAILPLHQNNQDRRQNRRIQQLIHIIPLRNDDQVACMIQVSDVTANISRERLLRQQTETLRRRSTQDEVTGLANRRTFDTSLDEEFAKARENSQSIALIIGDLDHFNQFNARHGREAGDERFKQIADLLPAMIRPSGDLAARYGGDEIALILPGYKEADACHLASEICRRVDALPLSQPGSGNSERLSISLGVALIVPTAEADTDTLLSSADVALYQAKHEGRNRAIFFSVEDGSFRPCP